MGKRRVLHGKNRRRAVGGAPQPGGTAPLPQSNGQGGRGAGAAVGNVVGVAADPVDVAQAESVAEAAAVELAPDPGVADTAQDRVAGVERERELVEPQRVEAARASARAVEDSAQEPCPACGSLRIHPLFRATDRFYGTTDKEFQVVECGECRL